MASVSNPVYTDTGIPVFGTPNTDTGKNWPVFAGICLYPILLVFTMQLAIIGLILSHNWASYCLSMYNFIIWKHPVMVPCTVVRLVVSNLTS
jgi:hypothetical protein